MSPRPLPPRLLWIALLAAVTFGCSRLPTAPPAGEALRGGAATAGGEILPVDPLPPSPIPIEPWDPAFPYPEPLPPVEVPDSMKVEPVDALGGDIKVGPVEVVVPAGAIPGEALVRVVIPDDDHLLCHLDIFPEAMNGFAEPVTVTFDVSRQPKPHKLGVFWLNEERNVWVQIGADLSPDGTRLSARLEHFSVYKVAPANQTKASW